MLFIQTKYPSKLITQNLNILVFLFSLFIFSGIKSQEFDKIDYCKNCDFLYEDPNVLVWSNDKTAKIHHMLGTDEDFILTKYNIENFVN